MRTRVRHSEFDRNDGFNLGRPRWFFGLWYLVKIVFFLSSFPWPGRLRSSILRCFGATVGENVYWKPRVNIHIPWKLSVGDHALFGEEVFILNFEMVSIGTEACVSQRVFICTGNHDFRDVKMRYRNRPISVGDGAWIGAQVFVAPGVKIGDEAVVTAGSIVLKDLPPGMICTGNPCIAVKPRWV